jgi:hypothetical protein
MAAEIACEVMPGPNPRKAKRVVGAIDKCAAAKGVPADAVEGLSSIAKKIKRFDGLALRDQMKEYGNLMKTYQQHLKKYRQKAGETMGETNRMERELEAMRKMLEGRGRVFGPDGGLLP